MKLSNVRCWRLPVGKGRSVYISYPEGNDGHDLITCLKCGQVYSVGITTMVYIGPPLPEKLQAISCLKCGSKLSENWAYYPETYLNAEHIVCHVKRDREYPLDEDSEFIEFPEIYS